MMQGGQEVPALGPKRWDEAVEGKRWDKVLSACRSKWDTERANRERNIKLFKEGAFPLDKEGKSSGVSVNLIFLYAKSTMSMLYGNEPAIQVDPRRDTEGRAFADAMEGWLRYSHEESQTEAADAAAIFLALCSGISWSKESFSPAEGTDVVDALSPLDVAVDPFAKYTLAQARWLIHKSTQPVDEAREFFGRHDLEPNYMLGETEGLEKDRLLARDQDSADKDLYQCFEIWERVPGGKRNLLYRDPKKGSWLEVRDWPFVLGRSEFPFSPLYFNTQFQAIDGFSELDIVAGLRGLIQDLFEFDRRHTLRCAAKKLLVDASVWTEDMVDQALNPKDMEPLRIQVPPGRGIKDTYDILSLNSATDVEADKLVRSKSTHDEMLGFGELQRGTAQRRKTATESEIEDEWMKSRFGESQRSIDRWKRSQLRHRAQISRQLVLPDQVAQAVGPKEAQAWATYAGDGQDLIRSYTISIRAGSTGEHAKRKNVEEAQTNLELFAGINDRLIAMGQPPVFDVVELGLEVARAREYRNPERFMLDPAGPAQAEQGMEQLGMQAEPEGAEAALPPEVPGEVMAQ